MAYIELNRDNLENYVKSHTDYFAQDEPLKIYVFGEDDEDEEGAEGFCNFVFRVEDTKGRSLIVKQAQEQLRRITHGTKNPVKQDRNKTEADVMSIKYAIVPQYIPKLYSVDTESHVYICEDCREQHVYRFELMKGIRYQDFPEKIGEFLAKTAFYTSENYLDAVEHKKLQAKFLNPSLRLVFEMLLFLNEESPWGEKRKPGPDIDPVRLDLAKLPWEDENFRTQMLRLRQLHMKKAECLVHGDLHTSNILIDENTMKIIDQEYTYMGLSSCDTGYLIGSLIYEYIRWFFMDDDFSEEKCEEMREGILEDIYKLLKTYIRVYAECWDQDAKEMYRPRIQYRDYLMKDFIHEVCGASGAQIISRVSGYTPIPDLDTIPNADKRRSAFRIATWVAKYLIINWESCDTPEDYRDMLAQSVKTSFGVLDQCGELS